ncbi:MAG: hypothetical protein ER33_04960 [Cyanobium sp. CACIAM 14]|nr:MAG: hypothetical protein ER33_04960 [Cyanobium sp. CACIAM 14]
MGPQTGVGDPITKGWRAFGLAEDLDVDFHAVSRPFLVTALLAGCGAPRDDAYWWDQTLGARTAALLDLLATTEGMAPLGLQARCRQAACGALFEFDLSIEAVLDAVLQQEPADGPISSTLPDTRPLTLRKPTGRDLQDWCSRGLSSREQAVEAMVRSLVIEGEVRREDTPAIAGILAEADPLVAFGVSCTCPVCGAPAEVPVDLEAIALRRLRQRQHSLLREIHALASRYGWSEEQILAIPPARRARYLTLIEEGA